MTSDVGTVTGFVGRGRCNAGLKVILIHAKVANQSSGEYDRAQLRGPGTRSQCCEMIVEARATYIWVNQIPRIISTLALREMSSRVQAALPQLGVGTFRGIFHAQA